MAHPAMFPRRGSSSSSGSSCVTAPTAPGTGGGSAALSAEDYQPPLLVQPPPPSPAASAAAAGPQPTPPPPQSLNLLSQSQLQPQPLAQAGAQMKKKSGFQITSVTPAQISASMSSNNSIAEDTESYDDLDESHTEDLSSSEILDVSLSRATDLGEPERSSSEETLNNFQEAETPGAVSPNQPHLPQQHPSLPHHPQQGVVINGSVHPHHVHHHHHLHHHHHGHHHPSHPGVGSAPISGGPPPSPSFRKLSTTGSSDNVIATAPGSAASSTGSPASVASNIRTTSTPGNLGLAQVQLHSQEVNYPQQKPGVQPPAQPGLTAVPGVQPAPVNILGVTPALGHQQPAMQGMAQQQLPYPQPAQPVQTLPVVQQQQLQYAGGQQQQQQTVPPPMAAAHVKPVNQNSVPGAMPEYIQHQQILQPPAPAMQPGSSAVGAGPPVPVAQAQSMQPAVQAHPAAAPAPPVAHAPAAQMLSVGQQGSVAAVVQPAPAANQMPPPGMPSAAAPPSSQVVQPVQAGIMQPGLQAGASGLPQQMVMAQQNTLLPVQPPAQAVESVVQGMSGQQLPAVSPIPSASTVPAPSQAASAVPPGIPSASIGLGQPQNMAQAPAVQNGSVSQPPLLPTSIGMPVAQSVPQQIPLSSAQFPAQSLAQSVVSQMEDGRRPTEPSLVGLPQAAGGESSVGAPADGTSSSAPPSASLFPLKVLPLTTPLVDGEDESQTSLREIEQFLVFDGQRVPVNPNDPIHANWLPEEDTVLLLSELRMLCLAAPTGEHVRKQRRSQDVCEERRDRFPREAFPKNSVRIVQDSVGSLCACFPVELQAADSGAAASPKPRQVTNPP
ncbi:TSC22 domain family protein 1 [Aix galericulata]|nr:TSC22 domain family protein 1 [Aix galericulata]